MAMLVSDILKLLIFELFVWRFTLLWFAVCVNVLDPFRCWSFPIVGVKQLTDRDVSFLHAGKVVQNEKLYS